MPLYGLLSKKCFERKIRAAMIMSVGKLAHYPMPVYWVLGNGIVAKNEHSLHY
jgi:hypothetical protein